ncbi:hypothetical protein IC582_025089 [Cucumis melo]
MYCWRPETMTTMHLTQLHTFWIVSEPPSAIVRFRFSPLDSADGVSPTMNIAYEKLFALT